jgi:hypothetical protein
MSVEIYVKKHIALGQKNKEQSGAYGQGFNYQVEAKFGWHPDAKVLNRHLSEVLKAIDHRHVGLDFLEITDPTTINLGKWILMQLRASGCDVLGLTLARGDGLVARFSCRD